MGAIGGSIVHSYKGYRNAPIGQYKKFLSAMSACRLRAPMLGGKFFIMQKKT